MARCSREVVLKILEQEKKKLDNTSVFGGFNRFMKRWLVEEGNHAGEWLEKLERYEYLSPGERKHLLAAIESSLRVKSQGECALPPCTKAAPLLCQPVRYLKGVGPSIEKKLHRLDIVTVEDLLFFFPRAYRDRGEIKPIVKLEGRGIETVVGKVTQHRIERTRRGPLLKIGVSAVSYTHL
ncbi:MAG: hypothetical protein N2205_06360, partial [Candidatus Caldatribacterium sp.]|nr:hypothetical protein [Candidatus Caldatribacterium sp.]